MVLGVQEVSVACIDCDPTQPRKKFKQQELEELVLSIKSNGLLQPISLRKNNDGRFLIIAGERRFRAVVSLGWPTIPAIVFDVDESQHRVLQLIENLVRRDLNTVETARAMQQMMFSGMAAAEIGQAIGRDASYVTWLVQILKCRDDVLELVSAGQLGVWVAWHMSRLSHAGQGAVMRRFRLGKYDSIEQVAICQAVYAHEHQSEMFAEFKLSSEQVKGARTFRSAFNRACEAFSILRQMEVAHPGIIASANDSRLQIAREQVKRLKNDIVWLDRLLKMKEAVKGEADDRS